MPKSYIGRIDSDCFLTSKKYFKSPPTNILTDNGNIDYS